MEDREADQLPEEENENENGEEAKEPEDEDKWGEDENEEAGEAELPGDVKLACGLEVDGYQFDLTPLKRLIGEADYIARDKHNNIYHLNVCDNVHEIPEECKVLAEAVESPAFQVTNDSRCFYLGEMGENDESTIWQLIDEQDPELGVELYYHDGAECQPNEYRQMRYQFFCDPNVDSELEKFDIIEFKGTCRYSAVWPTKHACPAKSDAFKGPGGPRGKGMGGAVAFVIIILVVGAMYLGLGVAYNVYQRGMKPGLEAVPHVEMWRQVPELVKEGCSYTKAKVLGLMGRGGTYEKVDGVEYQWG